MTTPTGNIARLNQNITGLAVGLTPGERVEGEVDDDQRRAERAQQPMMVSFGMPQLPVIGAVA